MKRGENITKRLSVHSNKSYNDLGFFISVIILTIVGFIMVYSSSSIYAGDIFNDRYYFVKKHILFIFIGAFTCFIFSKINYKFYRPYLGCFFWLTIIILFLTLIPGVGFKIKGARRWLNFGLFRFQTSELAKIMLIFFLAHYYEKKNEFKDSFVVYVILPLTVVIFIGILILLEPNFSTFALILFTFIGVMFVAGARLLHIFLYLGAPFVSFCVIAIMFAPYRLKRIISFLDPWQDAAGSGFQIIQSMLAIYGGSWFGVGLGKSKLKLHYLPEAHNDFIFSIIGEEFGVIGCFLIIVLLGSLVYYGFKIAVNCNDLFGKYLVFGIIFSIGIQALINMSVTLGLLPVTGLPLPFISYGGASFLSLMMMIGVVFNVAKHSN